MGTKNNDNFTLDGLKSKLEDGEIDLSMSDLEAIPIKQLSLIPKCTSLDLSINKLTILPEIFCRSLRQLTKLDLSKNSLTYLPKDIHLLERLQHLDLYKNKLQILPLGFGQLTSLRWLDLKDNKFSSELHKIVGDCLDDKQCKQCAKEVVAYMKAAQAEKDRHTSIRRQKEIENTERQRKLANEKEQAEKEKKKKEKRKLKEQKQKEWKEKHQTEDLPKPAAKFTESATESQAPTSDKDSGKCNYIILAITIAVVASVVGAYLYCQDNPKDQSCIAVSDAYVTEAKTTLSPYATESVSMMKNVTNWVVSLPSKFPHVLNKVNRFCKRTWDFIFPYFDCAVNYMIYGMSRIYAFLTRGWQMYLWPNLESFWVILYPHYLTVREKLSAILALVAYSF